MLLAASSRLLVSKARPLIMDTAKWPSVLASGDQLKAFSNREAIRDSPSP
jgi:hypothetical protein